MWLTYFLDHVKRIGNVDSTQTGLLTHHTLNAPAGSCQHQALALGFRNRVAKLMCGVDPERYRLVDIS